MFQMVMTAMMMLPVNMMMEVVRVVVTGEEGSKVITALITATSTLIHHIQSTPIDTFTSHSLNFISHFAQQGQNWFLAEKKQSDCSFVALKWNVDFLLLPVLIS